MNKTKIALISFGILLLPLLACGQIVQHIPAGVPSNVTNFQQLVIDIEDAAALVFGCIAVVMFVIAGIYFLTAGGEPEKVQKARSAFMWGVAGVIVGIVAFSIIAIVGSLIH